MKKYLLILLFLWQFNILADDCIPYNTVITITRQSELDSFPINYPNCTRVEGSLNIEKY
ncbi:MAG: hypothetical protein H6553_08000 [Chitinophagales bacterium]|nr:hypothetical protein [Chitinophagales bacterium]